MGLLIFKPGKFSSNEGASLNQVKMFFFLISGLKATGILYISLNRGCSAFKIPEGLVNLLHYTFLLVQQKTI